MIMSDRDKGLRVADNGGLPVGKKPKPKGSKASNQPNQPK